jgi:hypothetical protein
VHFPITPLSTRETAGSVSPPKEEVTRDCCFLNRLKMLTGTYYSVDSPEVNAIASPKKLIKDIKRFLIYYY